MKLTLLVVALIFSTLAQGKLLVLELEIEGDDLDHGTPVHFIACPSPLSDCQLTYSTHFSEKILKSTLAHDIQESSVVNMSFTIQYPEKQKVPPYVDKEVVDEIEEKWQNTMKGYLENVEGLTHLVNQQVDTLFVAAAGNGKPIGIFHTKNGAALGPKTRLYPQILESDNLVKVAALDISEFQLANSNNYHIASYSNFSPEYVDLAAPVEPVANGDIIAGTSFAAPFVSRLSHKLGENYPELTPTEIKAILLRSCHIKDVAKAIWVTEDLNSKGKKSVVYQAMYNRKIKVRKKLFAQHLRDVIMVKCGGVIVPELAISCAQKYSQSKNNGVAQACHQTHAELISDDPKYLDDLNSLWEIRGISADQKQL